MTPEQQLAAVQQALSDSRLSVDSRTIAAWLVLHPHRHSVSSLQAEFGLGRRVWQRVRAELQEAGYLLMSGPTRQGGRWVWEIKGAVPVDNSQADHMCTKRADEVICTNRACAERTDREVLINTEVLTKNCPGGQAPVDNSQEKPASRKKQIFKIQDALKLSKSQLGHILKICKENNCELQDVYSAVGKYISDLQGNQAVAYLKKCIFENPGRDWTYEPKRAAQKEQEAMRAELENRAFERFLRELQRGEGCTVRSTRTGDPLVLKLRPEAPDFLIAMSEDGQIKGSMPVRMAFETFISPGAE